MCQSGRLGCAQVAALQPLSAPGCGAERAWQPGSRLGGRSFSRSFVRSRPVLAPGLPGGVRAACSDLHPGAAAGRAGAAAARAGCAGEQDLAIRVGVVLLHLGAAAGQAGAVRSGWGSFCCSWEQLQGRQVLYLRELSVKVSEALCVRHLEQGKRQRTTARSVLNGCMRADCPFSKRGSRR